MSDEISKLKRRRGTAKRSITNLATRLDELEARTDLPPAKRLETARQNMTQLSTHDTDFRKVHHELIDLLENTADIDREQDALDEHEDRVTSLSIRLQCIINDHTGATPAVSVSRREVFAKRLQQVRQSIADIGSELAKITDPIDSCVIRQLEEELSEAKIELRDISRELFTLNLPDGDATIVLEKKLRDEAQSHSLQIKRFLSKPIPATATTTSDPVGVKLPKIEVPKFDGNILKWHSFWEQYEVSIHKRTFLSDAEKLAYLINSLKDGSAMAVIEGLSQSGDHYNEAIQCLTARYDRPRLVHQTHVKMIAEAPCLKEGSGREIRKLHDTVLQHLRALKSMGCEPSPQFITSLVELKLDTTTMFEWQKTSQSHTSVPPCSELLEFLDMRAQASEAQVADTPKKHFKNEFKKMQPRHAPSHNTTVHKNCVACKSGNHPLYSCSTFKSMSHEDKTSTLKNNDLCFNCLRPGHRSRQCTSLHRCKTCQGPHHSFLHPPAVQTPAIDPPTVRTPAAQPPSVQTPATKLPAANAHCSFHTVSVKPNSLLMTCRVMVTSPRGLSMQARGLLDSASSVSFISERLAQGLNLPRSRERLSVSGVAGLSQKSRTQQVTTFTITPVSPGGKIISVSAIIVPRVTCDLPTQTVTYDPRWDHLKGLNLADPEFGRPDKIDLLLGVEVYAEVMLHGRRVGMIGSPTAFETSFGWVLAGRPGCDVITNHHAITFHTSILSNDDILQKFWEVEERITNTPILSAEERYVVKHFQDNHTRDPDGRYVVPLPKKLDVQPLGESRSTAVRRFLSVERTLRAKGQFDQFGDCIQEYFDMGHAEEVPESAVNVPPQRTFYLPMHPVYKESSTTTKLRVVFDASAKTTTGISLNDQLLVGPTVHSTLLDVLLRFRLHRVAITTDVSKMYRAVILSDSDRDLHRFVYRRQPHEPLKDYRMTRVAFGVSASSFIANMCVKQNSLDHAADFPLASKAVDESFYVDDGLTGADSVEGAIRLQKELQSLFSRAGFLLRKWNSSEAAVLEQIQPELRGSHSTQEISIADMYTKTLGIEWNAYDDCFRLTVQDVPQLQVLTKRNLVSDVAKTFDVLGWFSPSIILMKVLLQRTWELKIGWDDPVPNEIHTVWKHWRSELEMLSTKHIPRCYYPKNVQVVSLQVHGFSDASEAAYAGVVYLRMTDSTGGIHVALVTSKSRVAPIKRLTIPRLELSGAYLLTDLVHHVKNVLHIGSDDTFCWTDSTIVLSWLEGNPRRFKTYVGNRVSYIVDLITPDRWNHVDGVNNPADCASRGIYPSELLNHKLWWNGPTWLSLPQSEWPKRTPSTVTETSEYCNACIATVHEAIVALADYSNYNHLIRVTAWVQRFTKACRIKDRTVSCTQIIPPLSADELSNAERYWVLVAQQELFPSEFDSLKKKRSLSSKSSILALHPTLDSHDVIRAGGREHHSQLLYSRKCPIILHGKHPLTKLIVRFEHLRLLHGGTNLVYSSLSYRYHIIGGRRVTRSIIRSCVVCRRRAAKPRPQLMGQLPVERIHPGAVFDTVGVDYAGPLMIKYGYVRKPTLVKAYICVFVSLTIKAVHLELVSDLTSEAFIATLRRFVARRGKPSLLWSDHGSNFIGANRELKELHEFLEKDQSQQDITDFCSSQGITWKFIPEHSPHFGGLWEAAVKSMKSHLKRVVGDVKLTYEECSTVLAQIEACLNSRPLLSVPHDDDGVEVLTPGHFLIGRPLQALPDPPSTSQSISLLRRWNLCQALVRHLWKRWSADYIVSLRRFAKWHRPARNFVIDDVVILLEDTLLPTRWQLARIIATHPGRDGLVRVVTLKTQNGVYKRPVTKIALLVPTD